MDHTRKNIQIDYEKTIKNKSKKNLEPLPLNLIKKELMNERQEVHEYRKNLEYEVINEMTQKSKNVNKKNNSIGYEKFLEQFYRYIIKK